MSKLKYSKTSWHAKFYTSHYGRWKLPNNICPYFWKLILALAMLVPFTFPGHINNLCLRKYEDDAQSLWWWGALCWIPVCAIYVNTSLSFWKSFLLGIIGGSVVILLFIFALVSLGKLIDRSQRHKHQRKNELREEYRDDHTNLGFEEWLYFRKHGKLRPEWKPWFAPLRDGFLDWYHKRCTPIDWS